MTRRNAQELSQVSSERRVEMHYEMKSEDGARSKSGRGLAMDKATQILRAFAESPDIIMTVKMLRSSNPQRVYSSLYNSNKLNEDGSERIILGLRISNLEYGMLQLYKDDNGGVQ